MGTGVTVSAVLLPNPERAVAMLISFNVPTQLGREFEYIADAIAQKSISGNGKYTDLCQAYLAEVTGGSASFLTTSCTDALEMAALLLNFDPGDEIIMPSYTFSSTANAVVLRGGRPVFVDIRADTLNIDERLIEAAITPRTKAIMVVHYAGVGCAMDEIVAIANGHGLRVVEDAAQALHASYKGRALGGIADMGAFSFHETKNIIAGEGGALQVNNRDFVERAEVVWEKGTNRVKFKRALVSRYNWVDIGSSFLPSEITAAFLYAQLEQSAAATQRRLAIWQTYARELAPLEAAGRLGLPHPPEHCGHNGHIFYVLAPTAADTQLWLKHLEAREINAVTHYVPLHSAPAGLRFGRTAGSMTITDDVSARLIRLPLHLKLSEGDLARVIEAVRAVAAD
jgi:dTDP-4-amino-4,6-dideoxygalactose transaminase